MSFPERRNMTIGATITVLNMIEAHGSVAVHAKETAIRSLEAWSKTIHTQVYDDEHEEYVDQEMTLAEFINRYTEEGMDGLGLEVENDRSL